MTEVLLTKASLDEIRSTLEKRVKKKEDLALLGAKHNAIQGSIEELRRHLDPESPAVIGVLATLTEEASSFLKRIDTESTELQELDAFIEEHEVSIKATLKQGLEILREILKTRDVGDPIDSMIPELVDAAQEKCPNLQIRRTPCCFGGCNAPTFDDPDKKVRSDEWGAWETTEYCIPSCRKFTFASPPFATSPFSPPSPSELGSELPH